MSWKHRDYFNQLAPEWNDRMPDDPEFQEYLIDFGICPGDSVLDIGAGTGRMTKYLKAVVGKNGLVVAEDIAENMLFEGRKSIGNEKVLWLCDDATELAIKNQIFDKVLCFSAFPHFIDKIKSLKEIYRVLRPGGKLLILHVSSSEQLNQFHASLKTVVSNDVLPTKKMMMPLLQKVGFVDKKLIEKDDLYWIEVIKPFNSK